MIILFKSTLKRRFHDFRQRGFAYTSTARKNISNVVHLDADSFPTFETGHKQAREGEGEVEFFIGVASPELDGPNYFEHKKRRHVYQRMNIMFVCVKEVQTAVIETQK